MNTSALLMMLIAIGICWGGLLFAILHLKRHPDPEDE